MMNQTHTNQQSNSLTVLIKAIRRLDEYEDWKRAVFLRDGFTCQACGRRNGRKRVIEAHHLTALSLLLKTYQITSLEQALTCPELWAVGNGQTLCHSCHEQTQTYPRQLRRKNQSRQTGPKVHLIKPKKFPVMFTFIKLTLADKTNKPVWLNPLHLSEMRVSDSNSKTTLHKTSDEDSPVEVLETPERINELIKQSIIG